MAHTAEELQTMLENEGLRFFRDPRADDPTFLLIARGMYGAYQAVVRLELDGQFLQFRTINYLHCVASHENLLEVHKVLGHLNYRRRFVKYGWDPNDGEIMVYGDCWLQDGTITQEQFSRMAQNYLVAVDTGFGRLKETMDTGEDPGDIGDSPGAMLDMLRRHLPSDLADLLEEMRDKQESGADDDEDEDDGGVQEV